MDTPRRPPGEISLQSEPGLPADRDTAEEFRRLVCRRGAPHHLAKYNRGVYEFAVDVLDDAELTAGLPGVSVDRREVYQAAGQQLGFLMSALDRELSDAETGRLIRLVLHAEQGALFSVEVTPRHYVLGIVFGLAAAARGEPPVSLPRSALVRDADMFVSSLATALRARLGLPDENPGGWLAWMRGIEGTATAPPPRPVTRPAAPSTWGEAGALADRLAEALDPTEVVYLARCRDARVLAEADLFADERVAAAWPPEEAPQGTRAYYRRLAEECAVYAKQLGQVARQAVRGRMLRIVLDVEQGALYYYRLGPADYLMGVTLNQSRVSQADATMGDLAVELQREGIRTDW